MCVQDLHHPPIDQHEHGDDVEAVAVCHRSRRLGSDNVENCVGQFRCKWHRERREGMLCMYCSRGSRWRRERTVWKSVGYPCWRSRAPQNEFRSPNDHFFVGGDREHHCSVSEHIQDRIWMTGRKVSHGAPNKISPSKHHLVEGIPDRPGPVQPDCGVGNDITVYEVGR